jgi:carbon storage regulator
MLILTRHVDQTIMIGDSITVTVLGIKGSQVRIGVQAPRETAVDRQEVRERKDAGIPLKRAADADKRGAA